MARNESLTEHYAVLIEPYLEDAKRAYGSRSTESPQHAASREYTKLLKEYHSLGGSLLDLAERLDVTYAGLRRRVTTADLEPLAKKVRIKHTPEEYAASAQRILTAKAAGTEQYHAAVKAEYDSGVSLARVAKELGLASAMPLYYCVNKLRAQEAH